MRNINSTEANNAAIYSPLVIQCSFPANVGCLFDVEAIVHIEYQEGVKSMFNFVGNMPAKTRPALSDEWASLEQMYSQIKSTVAQKDLDFQFDPLSVMKTAGKYMIGMMGQGVLGGVGNILTKLLPLSMVSKEQEESKEEITRSPSISYSQIENYPKESSYNQRVSPDKLTSPRR